MNPHKPRPLITSRSMGVFILTSPKYQFGPDSMGPKWWGIPPRLGAAIRVYLPGCVSGAAPQCPPSYPMRIPGVRYNGHPVAANNIPDPVRYGGKSAHHFRILANFPDLSAHIPQIVLLTRDSIGIVAPTMQIDRLARGMRNARRTDPITV